jgi:hypothetical protein
MNLDEIAVTVATATGSSTVHRQIPQAHDLDHLDVALTVTWLLAEQLLAEKDLERWLDLETAQWLLAEARHTTAAGWRTARSVIAIEAAAQWLLAEARWHIATTWRAARWLAAEREAQLAAAIGRTDAADRIIDEVDALARWATRC